MPTHKVFVFVAKDVVTKPGQFDQWCAFAETEHQAQMDIQSKYHLMGIELVCVQVMEDRRKHRGRRHDDPGTFFCEGCQKQVSNDLHGVSFHGGGSYCEYCQAKGD